MRKLSLSLLFGIFCSPLWGQTIRCAADAKPKQNADLHRKVNARIQELKSIKLRTKASDEVLRIPVVVHVIHNVSSGNISGSNISDQQILSQIEVLNEDYRKVYGTMGYNEHPDGADMGIEFYLAVKDPNGNPTNGINRVYSNQRTFSIFSDLYTLSNLSYWDSSKYLNIWVTTLAGGYLGYGEFPIGNFDGLETQDIDPRIDGVFIDHRAFGRNIGTSTEGDYTFGRTATHEIGHWLGLIHIWGDEHCGTDFCEDTPEAEGPNENTHCDDIYSNCRGRRSRNMIENFLDYSSDRCMNVFTNGQKERVRAILQISDRRKKLLAQADSVLPKEEDLTVRILGNPFSEELNFKILVKKPSNISIEIIDNLGRIKYSEIYPNTGSQSFKIGKEWIGKGVYFLKVSSSENSFQSRILSI